MQEAVPYSRLSLRHPLSDLQAALCPPPPPVSLPAEVHGTDTATAPRGAESFSSSLSESATFAEPRPFLGARGLRLAHAEVEALRPLPRPLPRPRPLPPFSGAACTVEPISSGKEPPPPPPRYQHRAKGSIKAVLDAVRP